ncbi:MAG: hypothetical protein ACOYL6_17470 [Bacteriovoracaceae bacterium]
MNLHYSMISMSLLIFLSACSFQNSEKLGSSFETISSGLQVDPNGDSDGDKIIDNEEVAQGRNPFVANLPELKVNFLQNYKIEGSVKKVDSGADESFLIDTKVNSDNPDFQYRVGKLFVREMASRQAAKIGKYSGYSAGSIVPRDMSWVKYPDIDPIFYSSEVLDKKKYFGPDYSIQSLSITVENSVRLKEMTAFKSIKNLELNFYYYNYEKESYELLATKLIERHFQAGVNEVFEVKLENIPRKILEENFLKKGEFIISEVKDFEIPDLETTYSELLASVKNKCLSVSFNTPLEANISYVSTQGNGINFDTVLSTLFNKNYEVKEDQLERIGQFTNNLPDFMYLKEIQEKDKLGKWFVLTNEFPEYYLNHKFVKSDYLVLTYMTGKELSTQSDEKLYSYMPSASGGKDSTIYPLGIVTSNSRIDFQISPLKSWGTEITKKTEHFSQHNPMDMDCDFSIFIPSKFNRDLVLQKDLKGELERLELIINQESYSLRDLVSKKLIELRWIKEKLHISIKDISKIQVLSPTEDNVLALRLITFNGHSSVGVRLDSMSGATGGSCPSVMCSYAYNIGPRLISTDSLRFGEWSHYVDQGMLPFAYPIDYKQEFTINVSSILNNYHN